MINIEKILKRSWHILWNYRVLWVFGILLALTTGGANNGGSSGGSGSGISNGGTKNSRGLSWDNAPQWVHDLTDWFHRVVEPVFVHPDQHVTTWVVIGVALILFILLIGLIAALIRYPTETAVMRMVDEYEISGAKLSFRQGWRLGWSRRAFRLWAIDLIMSLPVFVFIALMTAVGLVIYFSITSGTLAVSVIGTVAAIGVFFLTLFIIIIVMVFLSLLRNFFARAAALQGLGVVESLRTGWALFKGNWKSAVLMWLVMIGIGIGFGILTVVLFFLLIPAYLILLLPAGVIAFLPGLAAFGVTNLFTSGPLALIIGILAAAPFFFTVLFAPLFLIGGWYKVYESNVLDSDLP